MKHGKRSKKGAARRPGKYRRYRSARPVPDVAKLSETKTFRCTTSSMHHYIDANLAEYARATKVASAYQHFRIKRIQLQFRPQYDAFNAGGATVPYLLYMIDKSDTIPLNINSSGLRRMGAKPRRFDDKTIMIAWRPSVLSTEESVSGIANTQYKISPWLSTSLNNSPTLFTPSDVKHFGIYWIVEQSGTPDYAYEVECTVEFEFKKPLDNLTNTVGSVPATKPDVRN